MKTIFLTYLLSCIFLLSNFESYSQSDPQIEWQNTIGGSSQDNLNDIHQTSDGGYILGADSWSNISGDKTEDSFANGDMWVIKIDGLGNIQWQNTIGSALGSAMNSVIQTMDGGYIVGGFSNSPISGDKTEDSIGGSDIWVLKLDSVGNIEWQNTIGGTGDDYLYLSGLASTNDGGCIIGGVSNSNISGDKSENNIGMRDCWIVKLDSAGNIEWQNTIGGNQEDYLSSINQTRDGGYIIGASSTSDISGDKTENSTLSGFGLYDFWILKLNASGNIEWQNTIGGWDDDFEPMVKQTFDGGYVVGGKTSSPISGDKTENLVGGIFLDFWIVKLDSLGNIVWQNDIGSDDYDELGSIDQTADGGYIVGGGANANISGDKTENTNGLDDFWILKLDPLGNIMWQNTIGGNYFDFFTKVCLTSDNNYIVGGTSNSEISGDKEENTVGGMGNWDVWIVKLSEPKRTISGNVFADLNGNCIFDTLTDPRLQNKIVRDIVSGRSALTQTNGDYKLFLFNDTSSIYISNLLDLQNVSCLANDTFTSYFDASSSLDSAGYNFPISVPFCSHLNIDINSGRGLICSYLTYHLPYFNDGFDTARSAFIIVQIDTANLDSISSSFSFVQIGDSLFFPISNISPFEYNSIWFDAHIKCDMVIGTSVCARAYIYPLSDCPLLYAGYDSSDIQIQTSCLSDSIHVSLQNIAKNMSAPGTIKAYEDDYLDGTDSFLLNIGENITFDYSLSVDKTLTLVVSQNSEHPLRPIIIMHDELCALTTPVKYFSVVNHFSRYDESTAYEEVCTRVVASYDPNLKSVVPEGFTELHYTDTNQVLEYRIDFQNTGLDTAYKVVIVDTLNSNLDINTFVPLTASHTYRAEIFGNRIIKFIFDPIVLIDSNANETLSHGYVTFKIRAKQHTPVGTIIPNFADIYFDFNSAVRTNTIFNMFYDTLLINIGSGINETKESIQAKIITFPNPSFDKFYLKTDNELKDARIVVTDLSSKDIYELNQVNGRTVEMPGKSLSKGMYLITVYQKNVKIAVAKIVME